MTKIKLCGMKRLCDIECANELMPDFIGFVFAKNTKRYITFDEAEELRKSLKEGITPVGVFIDEAIENIEYLVNNDIIGAVQLHGSEDNEYTERLKSRVGCPVIQAFRIESGLDIARAEKSKADYVMLDSGCGTGTAFNHSLIRNLKREFFLAGGLDSENVIGAISRYRPYAVDASSSLETGGAKDKNKMAAFVEAVRYGGKAK